MRPVLLAAAFGSLGATSLDAAVPSIRIGRIESEKRCQLYQETAGRHREVGVATGYGAAYASETRWVSFLVRDCVDNFASLRLSLQAALAASGKLAVVPGTGAARYVVSGRISDVSGGGPAVPTQRPPGGDYAVSSSTMTVNMDVTLQDASGRIVYGGLLTKQLETGFSMETRGLATESSRSGQALYTELQHQVALAVARVVAFRIEPLRVTAASPQRVELNYGSPLLQLGQMVQVTAPNGAIVRYTITGAGPASAQADLYGGNAAAVAPGAEAIVIENEEAAAHARRFERVDLP